MSQPSQAWYKTRRRAFGIVFLLVVALLVWLSIAIYNKRFTRATLVTLYTNSAGNEMHPQAEVKIRGVVVGHVREISADGDRARLLLALEPDRARQLPANVSAVMLPTTLFGERYVSLVVPQNPTSRPLTAVRVIHQDQSRDAIELQQTWDHLLPTLRAVQPQKLSVTLTAIARALQDRGTELGDTLVQVNSYLEDLNPNLPAIDEDIAELVRVTRDYNEAVPDLVRALNDFTVTGRTLIERRDDLNALYATVSGASADLTTFLRRNKGNIIRLSADSRPTLRLLARYAPEFPCTLKALTAFKPNMDRALGKGTDEPGLHVTVHVVPSLGRYIPGKDTPRFGDHSGPHCYSTPFAGVELNDGTSSKAPEAKAAAAPLVGAGLGLANSPQENELVNELLAPMLRVPRRSLPDWSSVLVGPVFRGAEVNLK